MKVLIHGKTIKGVPTTVPIEQIGMVQDRTTEVWVMPNGIKDDNGDPEIVRVTDMEYAEVNEALHDYYNNH